MGTLTYQPVNKRALQIYDVMHLLIPTNDDERGVVLYSHSQADNERLKHKSGLLWTIPTEILSGQISIVGGYQEIDKPPQTPYDLWQWATGYGYLPKELKPTV